MENEDPNLEFYIQKMNDFRDKMFKKAKNNIVDTQIKQKRDYERKHGKKKVHVQACMQGCILLFSTHITYIITNPHV